jgi:hypothetical protein
MKMKVDEEVKVFPWEEFLRQSRVTGATYTVPPCRRYIEIEFETDLSPRWKTVTRVILAEFSTSWWVVARNAAWMGRDLVLKVGKDCKDCEKIVELFDEFAQRVCRDKGRFFSRLYRCLERYSVPEAMMQALEVLAIEG